MAKTRGKAGHVGEMRYTPPVTLQAQQGDKRTTGRARYGDFEKTGAQSELRVQANRECEASKRMGRVGGE